MSRQAQRAADRQAVQPFRQLLKSDSAALKRYIDEGGSINAREKGPPHKTLLHLACELRLATAARQLVEAGADVDAKADDGITPLMTVKTADVARLLLDSGADLELADGEGRNALYIACRNTRADIAKLLLKRGSAASITQTTADGFTALYAAVSSGHEGLACASCTSC
jgi:uncharacterized protein